MTTIKVKAILASMVLVAALLALSVDYRGGTVSAKEEPACNVHLLNGTYGNAFQFLNLVAVGSEPQPLGPYTHWPGAGISVYTFDGQGNLSGPGRISFGGLIQQMTVSGGYSVNADCTGSMVVNISVPGQAPFQDTLEFVLVNDGNEIYTLGTDSGDIAVGTMKKQFPTAK